MGGIFAPFSINLGLRHLSDTTHQNPAAAASTVATIRAQAKGNHS